MKTWKLSAGARACAVVSSVAAGSLTASVALAGGAGTTWYGPSLYVSQIDSAFGSPKNLIIEDFEAATRTPGLTVEGVNAIVAGNSVEADGTPGQSLMIGSWDPFNPGSAVLKFAAAELGGAPRQVGFVVTDASGLGIEQDVLVTVYYADGSLASSRVFPVLSGGGDPTDDFFIGVEDMAGIEQVVITSVAPISIDHVQYIGTISAPLAPALPDDFDGDGKSDVAWFGASALKSSVWKMDGLTRVSGTPTSIDPSANFQPRGVGDLNGDRRGDIVWREASTNRFKVWLMSGPSVSQSAYISGPLGAQWDVVAVGDLDGDGKADLVFRNSANGEIRGWLMDGATKRVGGLIGNISGMTFMGAGDINGDGKIDLILRDNSSLILRGWILNGLTVTQDGLLNNTCPVGDSWKLDGFGDLNGDGRADLVWRQPSLGIASVWFMDGLLRRSGAFLSSTVPANTSIIATPDLNGDGKRDLLWRNSVTGAVDGWLMNGSQRLGEGFIRVAPTGWVNIR